MKIGFLLMLSIIVAGCATMADTGARLAGLGVVSEEVSDFDGATVVRMSPAHVYVKKMLGGSFMLGSVWSSNEPEYVELVIKFASGTYSSSVYTNFQGMDINIDDEILKYKAGITHHDRGSYNTVTNTIYTESTNTVVVPLPIFERMLTAKDCRIRIHSTDGYEDSFFSTERIPGGQPTAILGMRTFYEYIQNAQQKTKTAFTY